MSGRDLHDRRLKLKLAYAFLPRTMSFREIHTHVQNSWIFGTLALIYKKSAISIFEKDVHVSFENK
jgi:hypothetical protein